MPICLDGRVARIGLPGGAGRVFGTGRHSENRDSCAHRVQKWADALFAPRTDIFAYFQLTLDNGSDRPLQLVTTDVSVPAPDHLAAGRVDTAAGLAAHSGRTLAWVDVSALEGTLLVAAALAVEGVLEFATPTPDVRHLRVDKGGMELTPVALSGGHFRSSATKMDWATEVVPEATATTEAICTELVRVACDPDLPPDLQAECLAWRDACVLPSFDAVGPALRDSCYRMDDPRLRLIPYPSHAVPIPSEPMAPLPGPPDQRLIPPWATSISRHALKGGYAKLSRQARMRTHERMLYCLRRSAAPDFKLGDDPMEGAPPPILCAFGAEGCQPWAAKLVAADQVLVQLPGKIALRDHSRPPNTHWNTVYLDSFLSKSIDQGLRCAAVSHGFSYLCEREAPIALYQDHLGSMYERGLGSVHKEIDRLHKLGRYTMRIYDVNSVDFDSQFPTVFGGNGAVKRDSDPMRDRRIVDSFKPRKKHLTVDRKTVVVSVGESCGLTESKRLHREASARPGLHPESQGPHDIHPVAG